jgi:hypothetical protein
MVRLPGSCPSCQRAQVTNRGKTAPGTQRDRGHTPACAPRAVRLDPADTGR